MPYPAATLAPPTEDLGGLVEGLKADWRAGARPDPAGAARDYPALLRHRTFVVDLAYEAYCLEEEAGSAPDVESFCRALPAFRSQVREVLRGHRLMADDPELFNRPAVAWPREGDEVRGLHLVRELGRGAFARVYLATDPDAGDREVALKLSPAPSGEARTLGPIHHPHVGGVHWSGETAGGLHALCMPFVGTATLADVVAAAFGPGRPAATAQTVLDVAGGAAAGPPVVDARQSYPRGVAAMAARLADALAHLHKAGIVHGDLKSSNVLVGPGGHPYLIDFNLAGGPAASLLRCGGTLPYMAPERVRLMLGGTADKDARPADVYGFGAFLFEALTGRVPVEPIASADPKAAAADLLRRTPPRVRSLAPKTPRAFARLVDECLSADPARRPTAEAVKRRLDRLARRRSGRPVLIAVAVGVALVAGCLWAGLALGSAGRPAPAAPAAKPKSPAEFFARGVRYLNDDELSPAMADFAKASPDEAPDPRAKAYHAHCLTLTGQHQFAVEMYKEALAGGFDEPWVRNNLAYTLLLRPKHPANLQLAEQEAGRAIDVRPELREAFYNRAWARYWLHLDKTTGLLKNPSCRADLDQALPDGPETADQFVTVAQFRAAAGECQAGGTPLVLADLRRAMDLGYPPSIIAVNQIFEKHLAEEDAFQNLDRRPAPWPPDPFGLLSPSD